MRRDSLAFALSGAAFGLLAGWIIGSQQAPAPPAPPQAPAASASPTTPSAPAIDQARVGALEQQAAAEPNNADVRVEIANLYFDAERFEQAAPWYEAALAIDPRNVGASTDLAVVYFFMGDADRALAQLDRSLAIEPRHVKALLNQGIIRWRGKNDLVGAAESWERVVALSPNSEEGRLARQGLEGLKAAHQAATQSSGAGGAP
jgi:tetratricopeptide (TPR) repeat protein